MRISRIKYYTTLHVQRDGRIYLGTAIHRSKKCHTLRGRLVFEISGELMRQLPQCVKCSKELDV